MIRNLDINHLRALYLFGEKGSIIRTAEELNLTQGAVSIQLKKLEESTGQKLFLRNGRNISLSPAGETLLNYARLILEINDNAVKHLRSGLEAQTIDLGIPPDVAHPTLSQIVQKFSKTYPEIRIRPHFNNSQALFRLYNQGGLDLAVGVDTHPFGDIIQKCKVSWYYSGDAEVAGMRPLPIVTGDNPSARKMVGEVLRKNKISYEILPGAADVLASAAIVDAGLAVTIMVEKKAGQEKFFKVPCELLPELPDHYIFLNSKNAVENPVMNTLRAIAESVFETWV